MKAIKKLLLGAFSVLTASACMLGVAGCGGDEPESQKCEHNVTHWSLYSYTGGENDCETAEFSGTCTICYTTVYKTGGEHKLREATTHEPTCEEEGYDLAQCSECQKEVKTNIVDALGHDEKEVVVEPTCTTDGYTEHGCTRCGLVKDNIKPMSGHNVVDGECTYCEKKESEGLMFDEIDGEYWVRWWGTCTDEDLIIPATHEGKPVVGIKSIAFSSATGNPNYDNPFNLVHLTIPASIRVIEESAFADCCNMETVTFLGGGNGTVTLGNSVFAGCTSLKTVKLTNRITEIPGGTFRNCKALTEFTLPANATAVGDTAFQYCENLASVTFNDGLQTIGYYAFSECDALTEIVIPNSVTELDSGVFSGCHNLTSVTMGNGVKTIGSGAFSYTWNLKEVSIPESVTKVGASIFQYSSVECAVENGVTYFDGWVIAMDDDTVSGECVIKEGTVGIADYALGSSYDNTSLTGLIIPNTVKTIGDYAFWNCTGLTSLEIPSSVKLIGKMAFYGCDGLTSVTVGDTTSITSGKTVVIGESAFSYCENLTKATIRNVVKSIEKWAFLGCAKLQTVEYTGMIEDWNDVETGEDWLQNTLVTEIKCSDYIADIK